MKRSPLSRATARPARTTFASATARRDALRAINGATRGTDAAIQALHPHLRKRDDLAEAHRLIAEAEENLRLAGGLLEKKP